MSSMLLHKVQHFLEKASRGEGEGLPPHLIEEFKEMCGSAIQRQFDRKSEYRVRMSGVGKPLCQQKMSIREDREEEVDYTLVMKFLFGDLIEAVAVTVLKASGVEIQGEQESVSLDIGGTTLKGTYDVKIDNKIYDIKSAAPGSFSMKFAANRGYNNIKQDDPFGYVPQGYLYSEAAGTTFGGWIAINKSTGEWAVCEAPLVQDEDREDALELADRNIREVLTNPTIDKCFTDTAETYKDKETGTVKKTGNRTLDRTCGYCGYKKYCWPDAVYKMSAKSSAKTKPRVWYSKHVKDEV
tara:strand:+ start:294 stop:1184 length:891 start_codon:yes stop_codon:yes gene_type:complete